MEPVHIAWQKALERRNEDPEAAITMARSMAAFLVTTWEERAFKATYSNFQLPKPQVVCWMPRGARHPTNNPSTLKREAL